jgi:hypothetical protein
MTPRYRQISYFLLCFALTLISTELSTITFIWFNNYYSPLIGIFLIFFLTALVTLMSWNLARCSVPSENSPYEPPVLYPYPTSNPNPAPKVNKPQTVG